MAVSDSGLRLPERVVPGRFDSLLFRAKTHVFQIERMLREIGSAPRRLSRGETAAFPAVLAESRSPLWGDTRAGERALQWGKVHNLRAAARRLDRTMLPEGAVFSFWRQMGRASARRGFVAGRMLQEGCLVPATGGGLCQLSNALYDAALQAGFAIMERHAHSRIVPGSAAAFGRDATVAWNYVDLRFAAPAPAMLRVIVECNALVVRLMGREAQALRSPADAPVETRQEAHSCGTCEKTQCFRHEGARAAPVGRTAFVVDENWPEFRAYVRTARKHGDVLALPLDGARWRLGRYAWARDGFERVADAALTTLWHAGRTRRAAEGPAKRAAGLLRAEALARRAAQALTPDVTEVVIAQSLLPFLWRDGHLGGRRFSVLMTRLPMGMIEARLNAAAARHPERRTLADFRADAVLVAAERAALAAADAIVTPHAEIAALFGERAVRLDWAMPRAAARTDAVVPRRIAFPGPTIARKGAYELREAARALDLEVVLCGSDLEGADFWSGVRTRRAGEDWLEGVAAVVQPALLEESPRKLLQALARGVPVIATAACGLAEQEGVTLVVAECAAALKSALNSA
ncbi:MAG: VanW family protein [Proteobacteria bacterium]|nr:VanW family protein [Pseudomonadota bacterium]